jgi:hypothetical protein
MSARKCFVQLGRYGDIINVLPLALLEFETTGVKPWMMVAEQFAPILDGVSYVEPVIFKGDFREAVKAIFQARLLTPNVVISQIYGTGLVHREDCTSFARQSWVHAGAPAPWGTLPLRFDRRDAAREAELLERMGLAEDTGHGTKIVLLVTGGISSPFPHGRWVTEQLNQQLGSEYQVVDISTIRLERIYDLLGLMDMAHCLVTTDTAPLHLAHASPVPVITLVNQQPKPWHGSAWRPNHVGRLFYDEFPGAITELLVMIKLAREPGLRPNIIHAYSDMRDGPMDPETYRRQDVARRSWAMEYTAGRCWLPAETIKLPDQRALPGEGPLPFVRDVVQRAVGLARRGTDIIALTNADVCFAPGLTGRVLEVVGRAGAAFTHRWDFKRLTTPFLSEAQVNYGSWYPGSDAFFFTVNWWRDHGDELGDYVMGREHWDQALRFLIKFHGGAGIEKVIYHEKHDSAWEQPSLRDTLPGNLHNRALFKAYTDRLGVSGSDWLWWKAIEHDAIYKHG